jgi:uncharacterized protein (DUF433 family)
MGGDRRTDMVHGVKMDLDEPTVADDSSPVVTRVPGVCGGEPILAGTRTAVHDVVAYARIYGPDPAVIVARALPHLSADQVRAALAYYQDHRAEIEAIIERRRRFYAQADDLTSEPAQQNTASEPA